MNNAGSGSRILRLGRKIPLLFGEKSFETVCFHSFILKEALKQTRSVCFKSYLAFTNTCGFVTCARNWRLGLNAQAGKVTIHTTRSSSTCCATSSWRVSCPRNNIYFAGSQLAVFQGASEAPLSESYGPSEQRRKTANRPRPRGLR